MVEAADRRKDLEVLPCVLVGNKSDKPEHQVVRNTVCKWLSQSLVPHYVPYLETSAKSGENVVEIFRTLLRLSFVMGPKQNPVTNPPLVQLAQSRANQNDNGGYIEVAPGEPIRPSISVSIGVWAFHGNSLWMTAVG
uniref:Uncharacterized protein n=1 Tax=Trichuris muris TaxID=70415 RepID=A0A5S6QR51_TRIMR